ncbi:unnamed protein product [Brassica rapa]|uniref:Reverse transcriptase Ty1/copia-type domain-containing protein n=1 Tax=Brassica campestris TaxID=3711 RepID=A0A8D9GZK5_BRACM|nr:unnamed protein product [Brassica rapa]
MPCSLPCVITSYPGRSHILSAIDIFFTRVAEYRAVANTASEVTWLCSLLSELQIQLLSPLVIYCDNVGAMYLCANPVFHSKMKHIALDYHFTRNMIQAGVDANSLEAYSMSFVSRFLDLPLEFYLDYSGYWDFSVEFTSKRRYDSYIGESFDFIFGLDFSDNELSGEIPRELGDLQRMRALNLSYNSLSGLVPESFCNLTDI